MRIHPIPPMMTEVVLAALTACDGSVFFAEKICRFCGGPLSGYDTRTKRFAVLRYENTEKNVEVILHRAYCRRCGRVHMPDEPFYPGTRVGSPIVDLCKTFSASLSSGRVAAMLNKMGIIVDRWSVRSYCSLPIPLPPAIAAFGMYLPVSIVSLSALSGENVTGSPLNGDDILAACNYPSRENFSNNV